MLGIKDPSFDCDKFAKSRVLQCATLRYDSEFLIQEGKDELVRIMRLEYYVDVWDDLHQAHMFGRGEGEDALNVETLVVEGVLCGFCVWLCSD